MKTHDQMIPLLNVPFHCYRWNQLKVIPLDSRLRTSTDVHQHIVAEWLALQSWCGITTSFAWRCH